MTSGIMNIIVAPRRKRAYYKPNFKSMQSLRIHCGNMHSVQFVLSRVFVLFKRSVNLENACYLLHSQLFTPRTCRFLDVFLLEVYWILLQLKTLFSSYLSVYFAFNSSVFLFMTNPSNPFIDKYLGICGIHVGRQNEYFT